MKDSKKGVLYGIAAAVCYGTNPLGALFLYKEGLKPNSVLFYRFSLAFLISFVLILVLRKNPRIPRQNIPFVCILGTLFAASALCLFSSFLYMDAGIASTLLFAYPVMVAILMAAIYKEAVTRRTIVAILCALAGVGFLCHVGDGKFLSPVGIGLVFLSALSYAIYIVIAAKMPKPVGALTLNLYIFLICAICIFLFSIFTPGMTIQLPPSIPAWGWAFQLASVPTVLSLVFMVKALRTIGSTPTAILGALEPLTAVAIGVGIFGEAFTWRLFIGIAFILAAVFKTVSLSKPVRNSKARSSR